MGHCDEVEGIERGVAGALASRSQTRQARRVACAERIETMSRGVDRREGGSGSKSDHLHDESFDVDAIWGVGATLPSDRQDGTALEGAIVSLLPLDSDNSRWNAGGVTDKNGKAKIRTLSQYDGVAAGKYQVTVVKTYVEPLPDWFKTATEAERRSYKSPPSVELVHKKFAGKKTTPLDLEVGSTPVQQTLEVEKP